ncbi:MAG: hypothetical protein ACSHWS_15410 [Sulfitobacter sp.]
MDGLTFNRIALAIQQNGLNARRGTNGNQLTVRSQNQRQGRRGFGQNDAKTQKADQQGACHHMHAADVPRGVWKGKGIIAAALL